MTKKKSKRKKVKSQRVRLRGEASEEAALRIEELALGLRSGTIRFANGEAAIDAPSGSDLTWEIEARQGRRKSRIEIEIRWRIPESADAGEDEDEDEEDMEADVVADVESEAGGLPKTEAPASEALAADGGKAVSELENPAW